MASCVVNADECRSVASPRAKGISVQAMASTSSKAPSRTSGRTNEWPEASKGLMSATSRNPAPNSSQVTAIASWWPRYRLFSALNTAASAADATPTQTVSYTHLRAHETPEHLVCRLLLEKK